jgi:hypothetical protein
MRRKQLGCVRFDYKQDARTCVLDDALLRVLKEIHHYPTTHMKKKNIISNKKSRLATRFKAELAIVGCDVYYVSLVSFVSLSSKQTKDSIRMIGLEPDIMQMMGL